MDTPVTERMCQERHKNLEKIVESETGGLKDVVAEIKDEVMKIRLLWTGNGKIGAGHKIDTMWNEFMIKKKSSQGLVDWAFRAVLMIFLTYISVKLGLQ